MGSHKAFGTMSRLSKLGIAQCRDGRLRCAAVEVEDYRAPVGSRAELVSPEPFADHCVDLGAGAEIVRWEERSTIHRADTEHVEEVRTNAGRIDATRAT
jgi:hypothetical protein